MLEKLSEEGNLRPRRYAAACGVREGPSLRVYSARAVQRNRPTAIAANDGRTEASPASGVAVGRRLSGSRLAAFLQRRRAGFGRAVTARSARGPSSRGEGRQAPKGPMAKASTNSQAPNAKAGRAETRESDARECDRASEVSCRSRWAAVGSREAPVGASREQREAGRWAGTGI